MVTNELSDLLMMPLSSYIGGQIWDVIEQTKLFILPFILMMIAAVGQAKKQGIDEGTPAIQAYKHIEVSTIAMFFIILFACKPLGASANFHASDISYKNYSCFVDDEGHRGIGIFNLMDKSTILNGSYLSNFPATSPTLMVGLLNTFGIGITNAAIASIPCVPHHSLRTAFTNVSDYVPDKPSLKNSLQEFDKQCYQKAVERAHAHSKDKRSEAPKDFSYDSNDMASAYDGYVGSDGDDQPLFMTIRKKEWKHNINSAAGDRNESSLMSYDKVVVRCSEAAQQLSTDVDNEVNNGERKKDWAAINYMNTTEGAKKTNHMLYTNVVNNVDDLAHSVQRFQDGFSKTMDELDKAGTSLQNGFTADGARNVLNGAASMVSAAINSGKVHNYQLAAPLVISIIKAVLVISIPLILFMTGYSSKTLLTLCVAYVAIDFSRFFLELGVFLDDSLMAYADKLITSQAAVQQADDLNVQMLLTIIGQYANYALLGVWYMFVGWMGVKMIAPMQMAESSSTDTNKGAQAGAELATNAATGGGVSAKGIATKALKSGAR
ncbi:conjugal transfer protein TraG N-terminal domain-containing protein [Photobacterium leiognathi]|uniref:conjugal transfer protein TraG N-terminal domain-containing protein n=1 Tax=Photobacterium leiognathi TaxID=553611 RepID=UPI0029819C2A|nr:conjugal transfer protein TraG N-terminal domain-containing protein [Photobacterium leiognathi]